MKTDIQSQMKAESPEAVLGDLERRNDTCVWEWDVSTGSYDTGCKNKFLFMFDGPRQNKFRYCPYCGRKIKEEK